MVNARFGFSSRHFPEALEAGSQKSTASLAICHTHNCVALGYLTSRVANAGMVDLGLTNAWPIVAPPKG